jgi:serine protease inhibitor
MKKSHSFSFVVGFVFSALSIGLLRSGDQMPWDQGVRDNTTFAYNLYDKLKAQEGNLFFSPFSISDALAMTYAGARGETQQQMAKALAFTQKPEKVHRDFAALQTRLDQVQKSGNVQLSSANSLWPSQRFALQPAYLDLSRKFYSVSVTPLDYSNEENARKQINDWVAGKTQDKIKDLIGPKVLDPSVVLTLVNAIYFKGNWALPFDPQATGEGDFHVAAGKAVKVSFMRQTETFEYAENDSAQYLKLPYKGNDLAMVVILPKKSLADVEPTLQSFNWKAALKSERVAVQIPKFKMEWGTFPLGDVLKNLGMPLALTPGADFSGIGGKPHEIYIGAVLHKAFIDVNEVGTEAAAATAVVMVKSAMPTHLPKVFKADHPFFFLIEDTFTGNILFMGRVVSPSS